MTGEPDSRDRQFEQEIRAMMRAHDHEAPTGVDLPALGETEEPPQRRREITWLPLLAAAAVAIIVVGVVLLSGRSESTNTAGQRTTASGALACPGVYQQAAVRARPWVPNKSRGGVDGKTRMTPDLTPEHVTVCAYLSGRDRNPKLATRLPITGHRELSGGLGTVVDTLTSLRRGRQDPLACAANPPSTSDNDDYLIGVTFAGGTEWVSVPGYSCSGSSNGSFESPTNLRRYASSAYAAGVWVPHPNTYRDVSSPLSNYSDGCSSGSEVTPGQASKLVPSSPTRVTICSGYGQRRPSVTTSDIGALVRTLNASTATTARADCRGRPEQGYTLRFRYAKRSDVVVQVAPSCRPALDNGNKQAIDNGAVVPLIKKALGGR